MNIHLKKMSQPKRSMNRIYSMKTQGRIMKVEKIEQINEALFILRHFINLSARLLPFLDELAKNNQPSESEINDKNKIINVFINYSFDTSSSKVLMDSNILENIRSAFYAIVQQTDTSTKELESFLSEHNRLRKKWKYIDAN